MEPTQAKPIKKRRRWLIAAFVLVLVSTVSWWHWPRGDARFVGTWELSVDGHKPHAVMTLYRNGVGRSVEPNGETPSFPWYVDGNRLVMGHGSPLMTTLFVQKLRNLVQGIWGKSPFVPANSWEVVEVGEGFFCMRPTAGAAPIRCSRISE